MNSHTGRNVKAQIAVIGSARPSKEGYELAMEAGRLLGREGVVVLCGGLGGIMEAVSRGVHEEGGLVIGIVPGARHDGNPWLSARISPGMGLARNYILVNSADGVLAVEGGLGTLSELSFARQLGLPIAGLNSWDLPELDLFRSTRPTEAVAWLLEQLDV